MQEQVETNKQLQRAAVARRRNTYRRHGIVAGLALFLALIWWWPLPRHFTTHVPGSETWAFDEYTFIWNLWWFKTALLQFGANPLHTDWLFHPLGIDLLLYTYNVANAALTLPLLDLVGVVPASNLVLFFTTVVSAWGTWLLVRWLLYIRGAGGASVELAALIAGALYAFGAYRTIYAALGHYDMVSTGFIPLFTLFWLKSLWRSGWRAPVLGGIFLAGALYNEMIFGVFLAMLGAVLWLFSIRRLRAGWLPRALVLGIVAGILWAPVGIPVVLTFLNADFALTGWGDALKLSADLFSFITPVALHPVFGSDWVATLRAVQEGTARFRDVNTVFVGVGVLGLALVAVVALCRRVAGWFAGLITFMVFSLGPLLQINGRVEYDFDGIVTGIPMPFILLHYIPIVKGNRVANRFSVVLMLCAAVLVGYAVWWILSRFTTQGRGRMVAEGGAPPYVPYLRAVVGVLIAGILLFEQLAVPLPLTDARIPQAYRQIAADPDDVAVLTLPLGWRNSFGVVGAENTRIEYYQTLHQKRLVSGNISRAPAFKFDYWKRLPVIRSLIEIQTDIRAEISDERRAADRAQAEEVARLLGTRYLVVHPPIDGRPPYADNYEAAQQYAQEMWNLDLMTTSDGATVYRIDTAPTPNPLTIDFGDPAGDMYRGAGWGSNEVVAGASANWALGLETRVFLPPLQSDEAMIHLSLRASPFTYPGASVQQASLRMNGRLVMGSRPLRLEVGGWQTYSVEVPADYLRPHTTNELVLRWRRADRPRTVFPYLREIGATGVAFDPVVTVTSAGPAPGPPGGVAYITVDGKDASDHRRGVNVTVLDPQSGAILDVEGFDTAANQYEAEALAEFIGGIPPGRVVVVAFKGDALAHLTPAAREALGTLGASQLPDEAGAGYALIGVKGAPPGTALEAANAEGTAYVEHRPDDRPLAAAVDWIRVEGHGG